MFDDFDTQVQSDELIPSEYEILQMLIQQNYKQDEDGYYG